MTLNQAKIKNRHSILSLSKDTFFYGIGVVGKQLLIYLSLPFLTFYLTKDQFGIISVLTAFLTFIDTTSNAGLPSAIFRFYNDVDGFGEKQKILGTGFSLFLLLALITSSLCYIKAEFISRFLFENNAHIYEIKLISGILVIGTAINFFTIILRLTNRTIAVSLQNIFQTAVQILFSLIFILVLRQEVQGYFTGQIIGALLGLLILLVICKNILKINFSKYWIATLLIYALPLIPETLSLWALKVIDRPIISYFLGLENVGIYELAYKVGSISLFVIAPFQLAWPQFAFSAMHKDYAKPVIEKTLKYFFVVCLWSNLFVIAFRKDLVNFFAPLGYSGSADLVPLICFATILWGIYPVINIGLMIKKKTWLVAIITTFSALMNIIFNIILLPRIGIIGAAISTFIAYLILVSISYLVSKKYFPISLSYKTILISLLTFMVCFILLALLSKINIANWMITIFRVSLIILYPLFLILVRAISFGEVLENIHMLTKETRV